MWDEGGADLLQYSTILIGDTVATGTTLCGTIKAILQRFAAAGKTYPNIFIWTIAGSISVVNHPMLLEIDQELQGQGRELRLYFANARFNLADNGTDLQFIGAQFDGKAGEEIKAKLGAFLPQMRCAVWDWGDRFRNSGEHLEEIQAYYTQEQAPAWLLDGIIHRRAEPCGTADNSTT